MYKATNSDWALCLTRNHRQRTYTLWALVMAMSKFASFRTTSTGSYLALFFASGITTVIFIAAMAYHYATKSAYYEILSADYTTIIYIIMAWVTLGWLMALIAGIGFDVLPLIHGAAPFHESTMRQFIILNISGQFFLTLSTFMSTREMIDEFSTVGIVLLSLGVLLLGLPGRRLASESKMSKERDEVGVMSLLPGAVFPFFATTIIFCWLLRDTPGMLELGRSVMVALYILVTVVIIVSHFNRRLNWNIIPPEKLQTRLTVFAVFLCTHILFSFLTGREGSDTHTLLAQMSDYSLGLTLLWAFILCNPLAVAKKAFFNGGMGHNRLVFAALWMLPFCSFHAFNSSQYIDRPGTPGYATFLSTSALLAVWGYSMYLHEDHLHINIHKRSSNPLFLMFFLTGFVSIQILFIKNWLDLGPTNTEQTIWVASIVIGSILLTVDFLRRTMLSLDTWHRIPMFYGRYIQNKSLE